MSFYAKLFSEKANEELEDGRQMIGLDLQADSFVNAIVDTSQRPLIRIPEAFIDI